MAEEEITMTPAEESDVKEVTPSDTRLTPDGFPKLHYWLPNPEDIYFSVDDGIVKGKFDEIFEGCNGLESVDLEDLSTFHIILKHFTNKMPDVVNHMNYYIKFYDIDREFLMSYISLKYIIDTKTKYLTTKSLKSFIMDRVMTETFMDRIIKMVDDLYVINIDTDKNNSYHSTPKITNDHARVILAVSFAIRLLMPACIHFTNVTPTIESRTGYIPCFQTIYMAIIRKFEAKTQTPIYGALCKFIEYRVIKRSNSDKTILDKKQQIHGDNMMTYLDHLIHEVIIVKSIYKLDYEQSVVSFFDAIIQKNYRQYKSEKFASKPVELSSEDQQKDSDDFLSHAEAIEMSMYRIDESNSIITKINSEKVMKNIRRNFNIPISDEEFDFYMTNIKLNPLIQRLLHMFYTNYFHDTTAINLLPRREIVYLTIILKKFLQLKGMTVLPQICTATVRGKFKENAIKNRRFNEKYENSTHFQNVLKEKFAYVEQLNPKDSPTRKLLSTIINSTFIWVDPNEEINGKENDDVDIDIIIDEFESFLLII